MPSRLFFQDVCQDHMRYLQGQAQVASDRPSEIESWFRGKAEFAVTVPPIENAELRGGRLCFLKGKKAALIFYNRRGRPVSLFQFTATGVRLNALNKQVIDGAALWRMSWNGYTVVLFESRGIISAFVSDVQESELLHMASAARLGSAQH